MLRCTIDEIGPVERGEVGGLEVESSRPGKTAAEPLEIPEAPPTGGASGVDEQGVESRMSLLAALLTARESSESTGTADTAQEDTDEDSDTVDMTLTPEQRVIWLLKRLSGKKRGVAIKTLEEQAPTIGLTPDEVDRLITELEREGTVYRSGKGLVKFVDLEL